MKPSGNSGFTHEKYSDFPVRKVLVYQRASLFLAVFFSNDESYGPTLMKFVKSVVGCFFLMLYDSMIILYRSLLW